MAAAGFAVANGGAAVMIRGTPATDAWSVTTDMCTDAMIGYLPPGT